jgi:hypothetical protein
MSPCVRCDRVFSGMWAAVCVARCTVFAPASWLAVYMRWRGGQGVIWQPKMCSSVDYTSVVE